jgi:hypothetical protein
LDVVMEIIESPGGTHVYTIGSYQSQYACLNGKMAADAEITSNKPTSRDSSHFIVLVGFNLIHDQGLSPEWSEWNAALCVRAGKIIH